LKRNEGAKRGQKPLAPPPPPPKWVQRKEGLKNDPQAVSLASKWLAEKRKCISKCETNEFVFQAGEKLAGPFTPYGAMNWVRTNFGGERLEVYNIEIKKEEKI
jgi:hypothetical protein